MIYTKCTRTSNTHDTDSTIKCIYGVFLCKKNLSRNSSIKRFREYIKRKRRISMIQIDYKDSRPIYEQIVEKFKNLILKGVLTTDEKLPSVRSLALELAINPNTIQKAYAQLERDGFIYTVKGRGNFVAEKEDLVMEKKEEILAELRQLLLMAKEVGIQKEELLALFQSLGEK